MERMGLELNAVGYNSYINGYVEKENLGGVQKALQMINGMDNNKKSGDSHQGKYKVWTVEESNELLHILVDAANHGWRDSNGSFSKLTVINRSSQPMSPEVSPPTRKRNRSNIEAKSVETNNIQLELMDKLTQNIDKLTRSIDSIDNSEPSCWDIIREIPNLDDGARFKALDLLNTRAKKFEFMKMTPDESSKWITHKLMQ
ncbi:Heavy metal transport/detoxification superfamily protein [Abeliophyllum distichum]|uniref:Heavy metal transport/detoxification superfamily protein n=1 Tax=Abeliophyllum distichum TaxID=126358 RepID=A0ABD1TXI8_9LAMI